MISTILPNWIYSAEAYGLTQEPMFREEALLVASTSSRKRAEFLTGRRCAHRSLSAMGFPSCPILRGPNREPVWPKGVVGSITHCGEYCAAAVGLSNKDKWLGIDAESNEPLPEGIIDLIASTTEIRMAHSVLRGFRSWDRLIFSAKESVYKAWYPIRRSWLDFLDVEIEFLPHLSSFEVAFLSRPIDRIEDVRLTFCGRYTVTDDLILTSVVAAADSKMRF